MNRQLDLSSCMVEGSYVLKKMWNFLVQGIDFGIGLKLNKLKIENLKHSLRLREKCVDFQG